MTSCMRHAAFLTLLVLVTLTGCGQHAPHGTLPPRLVVDFSGGHVTLRGALPAADAHDRVLERARQQYGPGNVLDRIEVSDRVIEAPWVATDALFLAVVETGISDGQAVFDGQRLQLTGQAPTETIRAQISTRAARAAGGNIAVDDHLQVSH